MLHERSQICTGKGADSLAHRPTGRPSDRQNLLPAMLCIKPSLPPSVRPSSACLGGRGIAKIRHRDSLRLSLSLLSLKWVALLREAIDYFEEEEKEKEMSTRFTGLCSVPHFIRSHNFTCFIFYSVSSLWINYVLHPETDWTLKCNVLKFLLN